jgi:hypothetical protein
MFERLTVLVDHEITRADVAVNVTGPMHGRQPFGGLPQELHAPSVELRTAAYDE